MAAVKPSTHEAVPGPRGWPVVGCMPSIAHDILGFFSTTAYRYKPLASFHSGGVRCYLPSDPEYIAALYQQDTKSYYKGHFYQILRSSIGQGIAISNGQLWARQRALMQPLFAKHQVGHWYPGIYAATQALIRAWGSTPGRQIDLVEAFYGLFQRISLPILFGRQVGHEASDRILLTLDTLSDCLLTQIIREPLLGGALNRLPLPDNRRYQHAVRTLHAIIDDLIASSQRTGLDEQAVLTALLRARESGAAPQLTAEQVRDEMVTLFIADIDTTSLALAWSLYFLASHPVVDDRVAEEAARIDWTVFQPEQAHKLGYTRCVIDEAMRLMPPAYFVSRTALADQMLVDMPIRQNGLVILCQYAMHRHPEYWLSPTTFDPERFRPDRSQGRPRYAYFPFGGGSRACLGIHLAQFELPVILAMICAQFRVQLAPGYRVRLRPHLSLQPRGGIPVTLERR